MKMLPLTNAESPPRPKDSDGSAPKSDELPMQDNRSKCRKVLINTFNLIKNEPFHPNMPTPNSIEVNSCFVCYLYNTQSCCQCAVECSKLVTYELPKRVKD